MNPDTMLRKGDCEISRTAKELIAWIESVNARFEETRNYAWMEEGLLKPFYEEIVPLGDLARHKYLGRPALSFRPKIGNQNYDAEIIDTSSTNERIRRVEFTSTYRDAALALRMEHMTKHGGYLRRGPSGVTEPKPQEDRSTWFLVGKIMTEVLRLWSRSSRNE